MENILKIEELQDLRINRWESYRYVDEPLMEYVWKVADHFSPSFDGESCGENTYIATFCNRYIESKLTEEESYQRTKEMYPADNISFEEYKKQHRKLDSSFSDKYLNNKELQDTIEAFGLDVSKLWYLLLFVHDYIEDFATNAPTVNEPVLVDFNNFSTKLMEATSITLKKDNRKSYATEREDTIKIINAALEYYINTYNDIISNEELTNEDMSKRLKNLGLNGFISGSDSLVDLQSKSSLDMSYKKWKFAEIFQYFLEDKKATTNPTKSEKVSKDKMIFISRLIYTVGYDGKRYNEEYDEDGNKNRMLSNLLRRYSKEKFPTVIGHYYMS